MKKTPHPQEMLQLRIEDGKRLEEYRDGHWAKHWHIWEGFEEDWVLCSKCGAIDKFTEAFVKGSEA